MAMERNKRSEMGQKRYGQTGSARARAMARRRKRILRRRMFVCGILCLVLAVILGTGFAISRYKKNEERKAWLAEAVLALDEEQYEEAIAKLDQVLQSLGDKSGTMKINALLYRAEAEYKQGTFIEALATYDQLLAYEPDNAVYRKGAVLCLLETGDLERALSLGEWSGRVYAHMAEEAIEAGDYDKAEEAIEAGMAIAEAEDQQALAYCQAVLWEYRSDFAKALECFEQYKAQYGSDDAIEREIAFLKTRQGND